MDFGELDKAISDVNKVLSGSSLERGLREACKPALDDARRNAPVDSGALRSHIQMLTFSDSKSASAVVEVADSGQSGSQRSAVFAEFGTSKQQPKPFMRPALYRNKSRIVNALGEYIANQLK